MLRFTSHKNKIKLNHNKRIRKASYTELKQAGFLIFSKTVRNIIDNRWQYAEYIIVPKKQEFKYAGSAMFKKMRTKPPFIEIFYSVNDGKYFLKDMRY